MGTDNGAGMRINWVAIGTLATVVMAAAAIWPIVGPMFGQPGASESPRIISSTPAATPQVDRASAGVPGVVCIDRAGNQAACGASGSGLVVNAANCDTAMTLASLGVHAGRQLDVSSAQVGDTCALLPGANAASAGATAVDITTAVAGESAPKLAVCYAGDSGPEVVCSQPHLIEAVSGWITASEDAKARQARCEALARDYTGRTFDAPNEPLSVVVLSSGDASAPFRCGVKTPAAFADSVWQIGGRQLATTVR